MNKYQLCSRASIMVGGGQISAFDGSSAEAIVAEELYEATVLDVLTMHRWRCISTQFELSREAAVPKARYSAAYLVPPDTELINAVTILDKPIEFDRYRDKILCDAAETDLVIADVTYSASEEYWPGYLETVVRLKLAAAFAVPIAEDEQKAAYYEGQFIRRMAIAKSVDSQGRTARKLPVGGFRAYSKGRP